MPHFSSKIRTKPTVWVVFLLLWLNACKDSKNVDSNNNSQLSADSASKLARNSHNADDKGDVILTFVKPQKKKYAKIYDALQNQKVMADIVADFNQTLALPRNITVVFDECDEHNAFYDPETREIKVCYDLIKTYVDKSDQDVSFQEKVQQATTFTMLHELGHALVDQLDIPITGKEENAVDEFAMMMLLDSQNPTAIDHAIEGTLQFYYDALDEDDVDFADVHAPSLERYFDLLTIFVGAHELDEMKEYVGEEDWQLPETRAENAGFEYEKKRKSWDVLLESHYK